MHSNDTTAVASSNGPASVPALPNLQSWWVVLLCALVAMLDGYDVLIGPVSLPVLAQDWSLPASSFAVALTATVLGMALGAVFIAPMGDRHGRRPVIIGSFLAVGIASLLTPLSTTVTELTAFRFVTGLGMGASLANALALAAEAAIPHLRSRVITCVYSMSAVGSILGGFAAPPLLARYGWQGLYVAGGIVPLLIVVVLFFGLPKALPAASERSGAAPVRGGALKRVAMLLAPAYRSRTLLLWSLYFLGTFTMYVISSWLPTLMRLYGWSMGNAVRAIMVFSFGGVVGGFVLGWLVDKGRIRLGLAIGFLTTGLAMAALNLVPADLGIWMVLITLMGAGMIGVNYSVAALAAAVYPADLRAGGIGTASAVSRLGATLAPALGGWLLSQGASVLQIFNGLIVPMAIGLVIVYVFSSMLETRATTP